MINENIKAKELVRIVVIISLLVSKVTTINASKKILLFDLSNTLMIYKRIGSITTRRYI